TQSLENKAINEWSIRKNESSKSGKIQYNLDRSHEDLNHPKLYKRAPLKSPSTDLRKRNRPEKPDHPATRSSLEGTLRKVNPRGCNRYGSSGEGRRTGQEAASHP
ncbi:hypothetical protein PIB30_104857, partial [Stylosanthes scabra]|nr:hypothetical protein [Stylosanthes scabra]